MALHGLFGLDLEDHVNTTLQVKSQMDSLLGQNTGPPGREIRGK
jgi:hypothetical protein